jgi:hypothetical protein
MSRRHRCSVPGCHRLATPGHTWCGYHRRYPPPVEPGPPTVDRSDLVDTGMRLDNNNSELILLGGVAVQAPPDLSLHYCFDSLTPDGRMPLLLPRPRVRLWLEQLVRDSR